MKILFVITLAEIGGAQSVVKNIANYLCQENEIIVISGTNGKMWNLLDKNIQQIKLRSLVRQVSPLKDFITIIKLILIYHKLKPDIIHLHSSKIGIIGRIAFPARKIVYTVHGFDSIRVAYRIFLPIERLLRKKAKAIVAVSKYDKKNLIKEGINRNITVIYNGVNKEKINNTLITPFDNNNKIVLCVARVDPPKKFNLFIEIAKLLPCYNFLWIGNSKLQMNLPINVICLGEIPTACQYYTIANLCILPSDYEGLPMSIIEAMSYGKPIVASNVGGISEIVINGQNGFTLRNNAILFAKKISYILENEAVYLSFSKSSQTIFYENHTVEKMAKSYMELYNK